MSYTMYLYNTNDTLRASPSVTQSTGPPSIVDGDPGPNPGQAQQARVASVSANRSDMLLRILTQICRYSHAHEQRKTSITH